MRPFKNGKFLAHWMMRISLVLFVLLHYWPVFRTLNLANSDFIISALLIIFSILLLVGGFLTKPSLTVISALFLFFIFLYLSIANYIATLHVAFISSLLGMSVAFYFFTSGNKG